MIAFLGMYDMPAIRPANDRLWSLIRAHLGEGPEHLTRDADPWEIWQSPDLLLAQTCGYPYRARLHGQVQLVGTPDYALPGCPPGHYRSVLVARADAPGTAPADFAGGTFGFNEPLSQSGWAGPMQMLNGLGVGFGRFVRTGAHAASVRAVAEGHADLAGIDAVTWALLQRHDPAAETLKVIAETPPTPGLPYITATGRDAAQIAGAVRDAIAALSAEDRAALHLNGLTLIPARAYLDVPTPPPPPA